jgi:modification target Cys-rich repeat protein
MLKYYGICDGGCDGGCDGSCDAMQFECTMHMQIYAAQIQIYAYIHIFAYTYIYIYTYIPISMYIYKHCNIIPITPNPHFLTSLSLSALSGM